MKMGWGLEGGGDLYPCLSRPHARADSLDFRDDLMIEDDGESLLIVGERDWDVTREDDDVRAAIP